MFYSFSLSASESVPSISGIYIIFNQVSCSYYIGSSIDIRNRMRAHIRALMEQTHRNRYLQRAYNRHGPDAFLFSILEEVPDTANLIACEQRWLDTSSASYNLSPTAGSPLGVKYSEEIKRAMSERMLGRIPWNKGIPLQDEDTRRKMSELRRGLAPWNKGKKGAQEAWNKGKPMAEESREKDRQEALKKYEQETAEQHELRRERLARGRETMRAREKENPELRALRIERFTKKGNETKRIKFAEKLKAREQERLAQEQALLARWEQVDNTASTLDASEYKPLQLWSDTDFAS